MGIIRNFVDVIGITPENELPNKINGQIVEYSEVDYIYISENRPKVNTLYQAHIKVEVKSKRIINSPLGQIIVLDGVKKIKLIYTQEGIEEKANIVDCQLPYNTFIDLPNESGNISNIDIHVLDAYFDIINAKKIYVHLLYLINVNYDRKFNTAKQSESIDEETNQGLKIDISQKDISYVLDDTSTEDKLKQRENKKNL
ncbi:hypothetical protein [Clostridium fungisolvens]|uniref:DUF3794 domain-containing protein n=1 Tax=Clostridium fungisolvens TaxID=1604897 RepID=A0A6V8SH91_9CLOT|nr:hypothetical protein [Clostridium fungisolvens]GFP74498.1 hypothetical protein bsdtw1_00550 [Clostridium fungisolvens]